MKEVTNGSCIMKCEECGKRIWQIYTCAFECGNFFWECFGDHWPFKRVEFKS